ncbi:hypothetical protein E2I00_000159, partial [Balaenoptera physalus]
RRSLSDTSTADALGPSEDAPCPTGHNYILSPCVQADGWPKEWAKVTTGCDLLANSQHDCLQSRRARIHQQINRELRMRTGAENLYRATSNARVRETVALELSYVNSSLQLLKEELEGLDGNVDANQPQSEGITVPMIPLGLKETKQLDWATPLKELISGHFGEDGASYEAEIRELEDLRQWHMWSTAAPGRAGVTVSTPRPWGAPLGLWHSRGFPGRCACHEVGWGRGTPLTSTRQATRTPSRSEAGLELLTAYYNQLCFQEARFEEALRLHAVCRALRRVDLLQVVLAQALRRSLAKYSELDLEDDFCEAAEAPDVRRGRPEAG